MSEKKKKIAVVLSGCGVYDGAEIHESVLVLLRLAQLGVEVQCMAPNINQMHVVNHLTGEEMPETRNVLVEAARIARGNILDIAKAIPGDYDAVIFPGGFGAAKNLCDFAVKGPQMTLNADVAAFARGIQAAGKPVGLVCIAPAMAPLLFGEGTECTIGTDADTAQAIEAMGGKHKDCNVYQFVVDQEKNVFSTPAYMLAGNVAEAAEGISRLVEAVVERCH
jgi:enhancing lycopene biosynthesis protein 2